MSHPTIMLVDDDPSLLIGLTGMLQIRLPDIRVTSFESPRTALAHLETAKVDTIVTDLRMKELDGLVLLRQAHAMRPHVPVVMMSGHAERAIVTNAMDIGAFDFLRKPFDRDEFVTVVKYALTAHRLSRDVTASQLHLRRMTERVAALDALIQASQGRPIAIPSIQERIRVSRQLTQSSVALMKRSLKTIQQQTSLLESRLRETEQHLLAVKQDGQRRTVIRYRDEGSID
ncbi:MAG TPA: response regulator [Nitrospiraceae bacterium]|nr:response regulator [Nitrospiraceae bacterium]